MIFSRRFAALFFAFSLSRAVLLSRRAPRAAMPRMRAARGAAHVRLPPMMFDASAA